METTHPSVPVALSIAGSDPSGGAGIQADLKTFHRFNVYGAAALTLVTVQNTVGVRAVHPLDPAVVSEQIRAVLDDLPVRAIKTGALGSVAIVHAVRDALAAWHHVPLVIDPVMISKHGAPLLPADAVHALREALFPRAFLITPNAHEAEALLGTPVRTRDALERAALALCAQGPRAVLVKGGHVDESSDRAVDVLVHDGRVHVYEGARTHTAHTHGTGCTFSAAVTALLARGVALPDAVGEAKAFITRAVATAPGLGHGHGPVNHWAERE